MMAALPKTLYGAGYLLITAGECESRFVMCGKRWRATYSSMLNIRNSYNANPLVDIIEKFYVDSDSVTPLRVGFVFATVNAQAQSIGAFIFAGASIMMFRERGILSSRMFLNLQWSIFPEWLVIVSVAAWGFSCIVQVERGKPILPNGRCMLGIYMYMNILMAWLATTNKSRAERVRKLDAEENDKAVILEEEVGRYEDFLFECRHNFACLNPAFDCKASEANGGTIPDRADSMRYHFLASPSPTALPRLP